MPQVSRLYFRNKTLKGRPLNLQVRYKPYMPTREGEYILIYVYMYIYIYIIYIYLFKYLLQLSLASVHFKILSEDGLLQKS